MTNKLNVQVIFKSIDGESNGFEGAGQLTTFIRLKGCNLSCKYCDTKYAQNPEPANWMTVEEIVKEVGNATKITITGGEPLLQESLIINLLQKMIDCQITIETNGSIEPSGFLVDSKVFPLVRIVMDYKLPSSGVEESMQPLFFEKLRSTDIIKFVISSSFKQIDYKRALEVIEIYPEWRARKVFSPAVRVIWEKEVWERVPRMRTSWPRQLAEKMIRDKVDAQFSLQIHKVLWPGAKEER